MIYLLYLLLFLLSVSIFFNYKCIFNGNIKKNKSPSFHIQNKLNIKYEKRDRVLELSNKLVKYLGNPEKDIDGFTMMPKYDIVATNRIYGNYGWVELWEIVPKGNLSGWNISWAENAGTATINYPPENVIEYVLDFLEMLKIKLENEKENNC